jgi:hypothetical protein
MQSDKRPYENIAKYPANTDFQGIFVIIVELRVSAQTGDVGFSGFFGKIL